jgi:prolyl oligopeptidase
MRTRLASAPGLTESIHGVVVADPYRWLEDRNSPATHRWIADQQARFESYRRKIGSIDQLGARVRKLIDIESIDQIGKVHDRYFYRKRITNGQQPAIFVMDSIDGPERLLLESPDTEPYISVGIHRISSDGSLLAYELKRGGEHTKTIYVLDLNSNEVLPDYLDRGLARGLAFRSDKSGYYYSHEHVLNLDEQERDHVIRFHRFATSREEDLPLLTLPRTKASKLVLKSSGQTLAATYCHDINGAPVVDFYTARQGHDGAWTCVLADVPMPFSPFIHNERLFAYRSAQGDNGEIIEVNPSSGLVTDVVVPRWEVPINDFTAVANTFYVSYLAGTETIVRRWSIDGTYLGDLALESGCTWRLMPGHSEESSELFLESESFTMPPTLYRYIPCLNQRTLWNRRSVHQSTELIVVRELAYRSMDGTAVNVTLVGRQDSIDKKHRPMIMTAYGGFGLTLTPQFSVLVSIMVDLGAIFAIPNIRGGGGYGSPWHEAARKRNRQTSVNDFLAAAVWLCDQGFTSSDKLAVFGGSNSGLLVCAAITQRPDLFRAAICIAALLDMVRYHIFDRARTWAGEYGTSDDRGDFAALYAYSPYHRVSEDTDYPATLFACGDKDTRCNAAHTRKMVARLQGRAAQVRNVVVDYSAERGHAPTLPLSVRIEALTSRIGFLCNELEITIPQEMKHDIAEC